MTDSPSPDRLGLAERLRQFGTLHLFSPLAGMTIPRWWKTLRENRFRVGLPYLPRAALVTLGSIPNLHFARKAERVFADRIAAARVERPLIVLGHWRSGTTLLQRLLAADDRYAFPTFYECLFPRGFLLTEERNSAFYSKFLPRDRGFDRMSNDFSSPAEDEFALAVLTAKSPYLSWSFPRRAAHYDRYLTFADVPDEEIAEWQAAFRDYLKRLTVHHGKRIALKSPPHTARISLLLELFPDAKFVHIRRNPFAVYASTKKMLVAFLKSARLQGHDQSRLHERIVSQYREMHDAYFAQQPEIPSGQFADVAFEDLERDPEGELARIYRELDLGDWDRVRPGVQAYLESVAGYRKNRHRPLDDAVAAELAERWSPSFDHWAYDRQQPFD